MKFALAILVAIPFTAGVMAGLFPMWALRKVFYRVKDFNEVALASILGGMGPQKRVEVLTRVLTAVAIREVERLPKPYQANDAKRRLWN